MSDPHSTLRKGTTLPEVLQYKNCVYLLPIIVIQRTVNVCIFEHYARRFWSENTS